MSPTSVGGTCCEHAPDAVLVALPFIAFLLYVLGEPKIGVIVPVVSVLGVVAVPE